MGFQGIWKSIAINDVIVALRKLEAGMLSARRPQHIAMSFHRLFLGGLLPSRARLRFTGQANNTAPYQMGQCL